MTRRHLLAAVVLGAVAGTTVVIVVVGNDGEQGPSAVRVGAAGVLGCRDRVEGGRISARPGRDTVIGPAAFYVLPENYAVVSRPDPRTPKANSIKSVLLVRAGERVTLDVPRSQRAWMHLRYSRVRRDQVGTYRVTLRACRQARSQAGRRSECGWTPQTACHWRNTQFAGGIYVDFDRAPQRGRCAELRVRTHDGALQRPLFVGGARCGAGHG